MATDPKLIIQTADIPSIPKVLQEILSLADRPSTSSSDLEKYVTQEPALVAQLLKWVNSAAYALPQRVSSVAHAMILLGFSTVKSIASGMVLVNAFDDISGLSKEYVRHVWSHTLGTATVIKILANKESDTSKDDFFLAAIIHDVGYLVLRQYYREKYDELLKKEPYPSVELERATFGTDHVEIGVELLKEWKFPEPVIEILNFHHNPADYPGNTKHINYLSVSDELSYKGDIADYLRLSEGMVEVDFLDKLKSIGWTWKALQETSDGIVQSLGVIDNLFD